MRRWLRGLAGVLLLCALIGPQGPVSASTKGIHTVLNLKRSCDVTEYCRNGSYAGKSLGPSLQGWKFKGSYVYMLPYMYFTMKKPGTNHTLTGRTETAYFNFGETVNVSITSGTGRYAGTTGSGAMDCVSTVGENYACHLSLTLTIP